MKPDTETTFICDERIACKSAEHVGTRYIWNAGGTPRNLCRSCAEFYLIQGQPRSRIAAVDLTHDEVKIDWRLIAVGDTPPFVYSVGLWENHLSPEMWASSLGECGHYSHHNGIAMVLNAMAQALVAGDFLASFDYDFGSGVLRFTPDRASHDESLRNELQTFQTNPTAPVMRIRWRCCPEK